MVFSPGLQNRLNLDSPDLVQIGLDWRGLPVYQVKSTIPGYTEPTYVPGYQDVSAAGHPGLKSKAELRAEMAASLAHPQDGGQVNPRLAATPSGVPLDQVLEHVASVRGVPRATVLAVIEALVDARLLVIRDT